MTSRFNQPRYRCPGQPAAISRAVHLARLADGYPSCGECRHRDDVEGLSERRKRRIPAAQTPKKPEDSFDDEGLILHLGGGFDAALAGRIAAGFGIALRGRSPSTDQYPSVVAGCDGRAVTQAHFAATVERLRWAGCDVVELGAVPCPALAWAVADLDADGGLYLGNPPSDPHTAGYRFFQRGGRPPFGSELWTAIRDSMDRTPDRPVRSSGQASRDDVLLRYESRFAESYHGLRPLRFLLHTTCRPAGRCAERLLQNTACKMELRESETALPPGRLSEPVGHFAVAIDDDGRRCRLWNERGEPVSFERMFLLLARATPGDEAANRPVVVDGRLPQAVPEAIGRLGLAARLCGAFPSDLHEAMVASGAVLGGDVLERVWYREAGGRVVADALATLTLLLGILSAGARPLSEVLDADRADH